MGHFYGQVEGSRNPVSRLGGKNLRTVAAGWRGAISVRIWADGDEDKYAVYLTPWQGSGGDSRLLAEGVLDATKEK
jgi:hypothetical protein